jgi:hypothetical protein
MVAEASERQRRRSERVLVLGLPIEGVESYALGWQPTDLNVAEYSTVIYYLGEYSQGVDRWMEGAEALRREESARLRRAVVEGSVDASDLVPPRNPNEPPCFDVDRRQLYRQMVSHDDRIAVFVGDPTTRACANYIESLAPSLFPWFPEVITDPVTVTQVSEGDFAGYLKLVETAPFTFATRPNPINMDYASAEMVAASEGDGFRGLTLSVLAAGRSGPTALGFSAQIYAEGEASGGRLSVCWLPEPTTVSPAEAMATLLEGLCGIELRTTAPPWARLVRVEAEIPVRSELSHLASEREALAERTAQLEAELDEVRRFLPLLWATGHELEVLVRDAFRFLGAEVRDPESRSEEDGIIIDYDGRAWVLEVKGNEGSLKQKDVTDAHKHESEVLDRTEGKLVGRALLVINAERLTEPSLRQRSMPSNAERVAARWSVSVVFAEMLLAAVAQKQVDAFDEVSFWGAIAAASVIADLPVAIGAVRSP